MSEKRKFDINNLGETDPTKVLVTPEDIANLSKERISNNKLKATNDKLIQSAKEYQSEKSAKDAIESDATDSSGTSDATTSKKALEVESLLVGATPVQNHNVEQPTIEDEASEKEDKDSNLERNDDDDER